MGLSRLNAFWTGQEITYWVGFVITERKLKRYICKNIVIVLFNSTCAFMMIKKTFVYKCGVCDLIGMHF